MRPPTLPRETGGNSAEQQPCRSNNTEGVTDGVDGAANPGWYVMEERPLGIFPDDDARRTWNVVARKIPYASRDIARSVLPNDNAAEARDFLSIGRAADTPDNDPEFPVGATACYSLKLTDHEAARFKGASNALSVEPTVSITRPVPLEESRFFGGRPHAQS